MRLMTPRGHLKAAILLAAIFTIRCFTLGEVDAVGALVLGTSVMALTSFFYERLLLKYQKATALMFDEIKNKAVELRKVYDTEVALMNKQLDDLRKEIHDKLAETSDSSDIKSSATVSHNADTVQTKRGRAHLRVIKPFDDGGSTGGDDTSPTDSGPAA